MRICKRMITMMARGKIVNHMKMELNRAVRTMQESKISRVP